MQVTNEMRKNIPILINTRDIYRDLVSIIRHCSWRFNASHPIWVYDNASTYAPLLAWYDKLGIVPGFNHNVLDFTSARTINFYRSETNDGPRGSLRLLSIVPELREHIAYLTLEPDLDIDGVPSNFIDHLYSGLMLHPEIDLAGATLNIGGLGDRFLMRLGDEAASFPENREIVLGHLDYLFNVYMHEREFSRVPADKNFFVADCDMACVLHRRGWNGSYKGIRSRSIIIEHIPWMHCDLNRPADYQYYLDHCDPNGTFYTQRTIARRKKE